MHENQFLIQRRGGGGADRPCPPPPPSSSIVTKLHTYPKQSFILEKVEYSYLGIYFYQNLKNNNLIKLDAHYLMLYGVRKKLQGHNRKNYEC